MPPTKSPIIVSAANANANPINAAQPISAVVGIPTISNIDTNIIINITTLPILRITPPIVFALCSIAYISSSFNFISCNLSPKLNNDLSPLSLSLSLCLSSSSNAANAAVVVTSFVIPSFDIK